jgi:hypothetical protein
MTGYFSFEAELVKDDSNEATSCRIPGEVSEGLGARGRFYVQGTINGKPFRGSLFPYGGIHFLGINRSLREQLGVQAGDTLSIQLKPDGEPRTITIPSDLAEALAAYPDAAEAWEQESLSHRRETIQAIEEARKAETRAKRINKTIESLLERSKPDHPKPRGFRI